jgi:hypothetical protein
MKNSDEGVYPMMYDAVESNRACYENHGLTKLEHFAGLAMQGYLASGNADGYRELIAGWSVRDARTLLAELERQQ